MPVVAGINYQGRDGEIHILDNSQGAQGAAATPWGLKVRFEQMDFNAIFQDRPDELIRLDRDRLTPDAHLQVGGETNLFDPNNVTFSLALSSQETDAILQMIGTDYAQKPGGSTTALGNQWTVKGTPAGVNGHQTALASTKSRAVSGSGLYNGGRVDGKGSAVVLPNFADPKKVAVDIEVMWSERTTANAFGFRCKEVHFPPGQQKIAESADFVIMNLTGQMYGEMNRITSFSRALDILQGYNTLLPTTPDTGQ